jgi:hypothetical protein
MTAVYITDKPKQGETCLIKSYFVTEYDRDFENGQYTNGEMRLYIDNSYMYIKGGSYNDGVLTLKDADNTDIVLETEPDIELFNTTLHKRWSEWNDSSGMCKDDDEPDYEPWALKDKKSIAKNLGLIQRTDGDSLYTKKLMSN